jgi:CheY-like chemotaxis protein
VIEPDELLRALLERWLRAAGHVVHALANASEAHAFVPDLVVADLAMPRRGCAQVRSLQAAYGAPLLLMSGRFPRGACLAPQAGQAMLPKPYTEAELLSAVDMLLGAGRAAGGRP